MKPFSRGLFFLVALLVLGVSLPVFAQYETIVNRAKPSVVLIAVERVGARNMVTGSGFFVDPRGYIVTARHVIEGANRVVVLTSDGKQLPAIIVRYSTLFDGAVLKVEGIGFPALTFGDSDTVRQGQEVLLLGYPRVDVLGAESVTVTRGIVSALRPGEGLLQIDAALNSGNSGGPVLNARGEVIGIAVASIRSGQLLNFAVASNLLRTIATNLNPVAIPAPSPASPPSVAQPTPPPGPPGPEEAFLITPGQGIGRVRLGMQLQEVTTIMGPSIGAETNADGISTLRWYAPPSNSGIVVKATRAGVVYAVRVLNDPNYATLERLRAGSTEDEVRRVLGEPTRINLDQNRGDKFLEYHALGIDFTINLDSQYNFHNAVYDIVVYQKR